MIENYVLRDGPKPGDERILSLPLDPLERLVGPHEHFLEDVVALDLEVLAQAAAYDPEKARAAALGELLEGPRIGALRAGEERVLAFLCRHLSEPLYLDKYTRDGNRTKKRKNRGSILHFHRRRLPDNHQSMRKSSAPKTRFATHERHRHTAPLDHTTNCDLPAPPWASCEDTARLSGYAAAGYR